MANAQPPSCRGALNPGAMRSRAVRQHGSCGSSPRMTAESEAVLAGPDSTRGPYPFRVPAFAIPSCGPSARFGASSQNSPHFLNSSFRCGLSG